MVWPSSNGWAFCHEPLGAAAMRPRFKSATPRGRAAVPWRILLSVALISGVCVPEAELRLTVRSRGPRLQRQIEIEVCGVQPLGSNFSLRVVHRDFDGVGPL